ncbi:protein of unknown function (plasmid) [Caballeronia sp. S22]
MTGVPLSRHTSSSAGLRQDARKP